MKTWHYADTNKNQHQVSMEEDILFESKMGAGTQPDQGLMGKLLGAGKRMLTGESIFMTHFTHRGDSQKRRVAFAAPDPGKIIPIDLQTVGGELFCLAHAPGSDGSAKGEGSVLGGIGRMFDGS